MESTNLNNLIEDQHLAQDEIVNLLVHYGQSTKRLQVKKSSLKDLDSILMQLFKIPDFIVQVYDHQWETYVDVENYSLIKDHSKLKLESISSPNIPRTPCNSSEDSRTSTTSSDSEEIPTSQNRLSWVMLQIDQRKFSDQLKEQLDSGRRLTWSTRHEFIEYIQNHVFTHTRYPRSGEITQLCRNLIVQFPSLKEEIGSGFDSLRQRIINKLKNSRRKLSSPDVLIKKRKTKSDFDKKLSYFDKKGVVNWFPENVPSTSVDTDSGELLRKEFEKPYGRDKSKIIELTRNSFPERRKLVNGGESVSIILDKYPSLRLPEHQSSEFNRLMSSEGFYTTFTKNIKKYALPIVNYTSSKTKLSEHMRAELKQLNEYKEKTKDIQDMHHCISALCLLPDLLGCKKEFIISYPETSTQQDILKDLPSPAPYVASIGGCHTSSNFYVIVEKNIITQTQDLIEAVYYMFINYYIFNIEYPKQCYGFFEYLQIAVLEIKSEGRISSKVVNFFQKVKAELE